MRGFVCRDEEGKRKSDSKERELLFDSLKRIRCWQSKVSACELANHRERAMNTHISDFMTWMNACERRTGRIHYDPYPQASETHFLPFRSVVEHPTLLRHPRARPHSGNRQSAQPCRTPRSNHPNPQAPRTSSARTLSILNTRHKDVAVEFQQSRELEQHTIQLLQLLRPPYR